MENKILMLIVGIMALYILFTSKGQNILKGVIGTTQAVEPQDNTNTDPKEWIRQNLPKLSIPKIKLP